MAMSNKVFIYNGEGTNPESVNDLKELFSSDNIFSTHPDISLCNFKFNPIGLSTPTFVVPGGSTTVIGRFVKPELSRFREIFEEDYNFVGVCAGAFIATENADLFITHKIDNSSTLLPPSYLFSTPALQANINIIDDYQAVGSFYPNDSYLHDQPKCNMPYRVSLLTEKKQTFSQLYLAGPGFFSSRQTNSQSEVVATYINRDPYVFNYPSEKKEFKQLSAMIRSKPTDSRRGGRFLSGTHIESCVPYSKLLNLFKSDSEKTKALKKNDYEILINERQDTQNFVESLLADTLKGGRNRK